MSKQLTLSLLWLCNTRSAPDTEQLTPVPIHNIPRAQGFPQVSSCRMQPQLEDKPCTQNDSSKYQLTHTFMQCQAAGSRPSTKHSWCSTSPIWQESCLKPTETQLLAGKDTRFSCSRRWQKPFMHLLPSIRPKRSAEPIPVPFRHCLSATKRSPNK